MNMTQIRNGALIVCATIPLATHAADILSEDRARTMAIQILKGDPYGKTARDVTQNLRSSQLVMNGGIMCGDRKTSTPVWQFRVVVPANRNPDGKTIDGYLVLDGRTGKMVCAGLSFLD